jgi:peptidoglycan-associated lipoprotein
MTIHRFALAALAAAALAGCSTTSLDETPKAPVETRPTAPATAAQPTAPVVESKVQTVDLAAELTKAVADKRVIYFDYDSFVVKEEFRGTVDAHAKRLNQIKTQKVLLEGHADDRGSREYNLALGQKRAEAVAQQLSLAGVAAGQAEPVSFGKERPAVQGSGEAVWAKNRRVEVKDK